jgi:hypothetical protein
LTDKTLEVKKQGYAKILKARCVYRVQNKSSGTDLDVQIRSSRFVNQSICFPGVYLYVVKCPLAGGKTKNISLYHLGGKMKGGRDK